MSRIAKRPLAIPAGASISQQDKSLVITGPKGELRVAVPAGVTLTIDQSEVRVPKVTKHLSPYQGLVMRLIASALEGVTQGFTKQLEVNGVGYRAAVTGQALVLNVGFSHPVEMTAPGGIELGVAKNVITVSGIDKQLVGQVAAEIRAVRKPEPYKGKGIRYVDEHVRRKAGKAAKAAGASA